ncbi:hypothetical protein H2199_002117 [Coniosporium tulheliwenetii]|uniref:Uncharacterized protein n=1 Tax=Coniosporium tulheliwenetii TaxID=3383036 RepID=A0ACC2ZHW3_9PEZI|nr:hypothetical protein H2199_002117 [Cladosporium sp. JES 115]
MTTTMASSHEALVFSSVFPVSAHHTTPTPLATPDLGFTTEGQSFGGVDITSPLLSSRPVAQEIKQNQAWSVATRYLSLARAPFSQISQWNLKQAPTRDISDALRYLLAGEGAQAAGDEGQSLLDWYVNEIRGHYLACVQPSIQPLWKPGLDCRHSWSLLEETVNRLGQAQALYLQPLRDYVLPIIHDAPSNTSTAQQGAVHSKATQLASKFRRDLDAVITHSIPLQLVSKALSYVLFDAGCRIFDIHPNQAEPKKPAREDVLHARNRTVRLLRGLREVGLAGDQAQRAFAQAMDKLLGQFIVSHHMKVDWYGRAPVTKKLRQWVKEGFAPFATEVMECLSAGETPLPFGPLEIQQWQDMATQRLGRARVDNLFDYVVNWDRSLGAILDLKDYITTPAARSHLAISFSKQLSRRLLHAGATTTHILNVYIYVIRAFNELDPKAVLLDRVAKPIRRHLRDRPDTARIIVASLLADVQDSHGNTLHPSGDISLEIATEMLHPVASQHDHDHDLDWGNMAWTPDPVDAGPEYRKSRSTDIISSLLSLYDREDFITELKAILGAHLLSATTPGFEKEIRLLELFKLRLGEEKLQACEVMLRDVLESKRIDASIRGTISRNPFDVSPDTKTRSTRRTTPPRPNPLLLLLAPLRDDTFLPPAAVRAAQSRYAAGFERVKDMRKLHWMHALGRASVRLELEDRVVEEEVATWQAAVIDAFGEDGEAGDEARRSVAQLEAALEMDEELVRNALAFWIGRGVLRETAPDSDVFEVLERLPAANDAGAAASAATSTAGQAARPAAVQAIKSQQDVLEENTALYRQFILGMLTNQGAMPAPRILMMLKMAVPGGFGGGVEELRGLLGGMAEEGILQGGGDVWGVKK